MFSQLMSMILTEDFLFSIIRITAPILFAAMGAVVAEKAGVTVGEGGLITALRAMTSAGTGADVSLRDISKAYGGERPIRILFSEVPGVIIQIADIDYDYVDAELILQDVVYFPLGHPVPGRPSVELTAQVEIPQILESLLNTLEGED